MAWFKVDDGFSTSPKVLSIPRSSRMAAVGLWTIAGTWCAKHLTDGHVPNFMIDEWGADESLAVALVKAGLWVEDAEGYVFHDWSDYQPSRLEVNANREKERQRKESYRAKKGANQSDSPSGTTVGQEESSHGVSGPPDPTHPDPSRPSTSDEVEGSSSEPDGSDAKRFSADVIRLCDTLAELVRLNGNKVGVVGTTWWLSCDRLIRLDGYTAKQIEWVMQWSQQNEFWQSNVMSMPKLREKFDQLKTKAMQEAAARKQPQDARKQTPTERALSTLSLPTDFGPKGITS
ncbi:hypothetical protein B7R22_17020 [Subtercola boreus]|uniref:Lin1244/Lin1753-like N-terminal domain-containing protein n=1 Tax=Subtercola boreus TaxID=120213 RepID=A0A3E0VQ69_9MICO|nr:hypothetical protein [Subtercola boreus]RFA12132.1 hypothetical protein B7R22_17020 [Subtercola boreus]